MKKINNRRKSRELVMKSIYRGLLNTFDFAQIKKDIVEDPDFCPQHDRPQPGARHQPALPELAARDL